MNWHDWMRNDKTLLGLLMLAFGKARGRSKRRARSAKLDEHRLPLYRPPTHPGEMLIEEFVKIFAVPHAILDRISAGKSVGFAYDPHKAINGKPPTLNGFASPACRIPE